MRNGKAKRILIDIIIIMVLTMICINVVIIVICLKPYKFNSWRGSLSNLPWIEVYNYDNEIETNGYISKEAAIDIATTHAKINKTEKLKSELIDEGKLFVKGGITDELRMYWRISFLTPTSNKEATQPSYCFYNIDYYSGEIISASIGPYWYKAMDFIVPYENSI